MAGVLVGEPPLLPKNRLKTKRVADREGFEPSVGFHLHTLSKRARSTTPPPVRFTPRLARRRRSIRREAGLIEHTRPLGKRL